MNALKKKTVRRNRRKKHVRKHVTGTPERPRLSVYRSHKNIYAQIIDDTAGQTLVAANSCQIDNGGNKTAAQSVGKELAAKAVGAGIEAVVFDRNGYAYHGRIKELADAAREGGLKF
jgi:large subunit ribosomal protein L18